MMAAKFSRKNMKRNKTPVQKSTVLNRENTQNWIQGNQKSILNIGSLFFFSYKAYCLCFILIFGKLMNVIIIFQTHKRTKRDANKYICMYSIQQEMIFD